MKVGSFSGVICFASCLSCTVFPVWAIDGEAEFVITAPAMQTPLRTEFDPKTPQQPLPAYDGASFLKNVSGFSIIRKGGTDGDPVLRGMSGSRLGILLDGQEIYGGCGGRMDPPTAYVYPEAYDKVTVLKGPQSVLYGAGFSAGVVLFENTPKRLSQRGITGQASLTAGSFGRQDEVFHATVGTPDVYLKATGTRAQSKDYSDGSGKAVHSAYTRWSTSASIGWTPDDTTLLALSAVKSDGEAAYADRSMDGSKFKRDNVAFKFEKRNLSSFFEKIEAQAYYNYVDHVMDNYSLRQHPTGSYSAMNPDRTTVGGRVAVTFNPTDKIRLIVGMDTKKDTHRSRMGMSMMSGAAATAAYQAASWSDDMIFNQNGVFGEGTFFIGTDSRLITGVRFDQQEATDKRSTSPTRGQTDKKDLSSGFIRYEKDVPQLGTYYVGLGHSARFADYWERLTTTNVFMTLQPEKTTQFDTGLTWKQGAWSGNVSGFYSSIQDYMQISWVAPTVTRNIKATVYGGEAQVRYQWTPVWSTSAALAYVHGDNTTDHKPLAQQPPLELKLGVNYDQKTYSFGALWRGVARQTRFDLNAGNIVSQGKDLGETGGFSTLSLHGGWKPKKGILIAVGVDNVFNKSYAEHISKGGALIPGGYEQTTRVNEPGRTLWLKGQLAF